MSEDTKKVLDVRFPKEEQEKSKELEKVLRSKKWQVDVQVDNKVRFMYGDDPKVLQDFAKAKGYKILKVTKLE